ncbi:MAG: hypothetical protein IKU69_01695 [Roseburia sp.]|nr:hypothetical protein [Roseburia sp.]
MVTFGRDLIAEKNKRESIKSSVIKYWNVNYFDPAEQKRLEEEAKLQEAQEIIDRLAREAAEDEAKKQAEIDQAYIEAELNDLVREMDRTYNADKSYNADKIYDDKTYNATTGSYSGTYGQGKVDNVTQDQVAMILNEKNAALQGIINSRNGN